VKRKLYAGFKQAGKISTEGMLKELIARVRADAQRDWDAGRKMEAARLFKIADEMAQRDLLPKPTRKKREQFSLWPLEDKR
jgi:hypothetical protein